MKKKRRSLIDQVRSVRTDATTSIPAPPPVPVSVTLIVKNCAASLAECLDSVKRTFLRPCDEIVVLDTGSTDDTAAVAKRAGARVIDGTHLRKDMGALVKQWLPGHLEKFGGEQQFAAGAILDFAEARQVVTDAAKNDVIFWLDSDDILAEDAPGALRAVIDRHMGKEIDALFLSYLYSFDKHDGRPTTILKRERVVDRRAYRWAGKCHETLIPREGVVLKGCGWFDNLPSTIVHKHARTDHTLSDIRNYVIIRSEIEADLSAGRRPDTRSIFYLGNACRGLRLHSEAITMYRKTLGLSGSRDDRFSSAYYICISYLAPEIQRPLEALDFAYECIKLKPEDPRGYFAIARCFHIMGRHEDSLRYFDIGRGFPEPTTLHSYDPEHVHTLPYFIAISAAKELKDEERIKQLCGVLSERRGGHPDVQQIVGDAGNWLAGQALCRSVQSVCVNMRPEGPKAQLAAARKVVDLLPEVPDDLEKAGIGKVEPADERPVSATYVNDGGETVTESRTATVDDDLVFWCGHTLEAWGPRSDGIGGSEKAVIQMAPRLQKRGFRVTVYCNVPADQRGPDAATGVVWRHWSEFDVERPRGTVIFWRSPGALESPWPIKKRILWAHDVQRPEHWTDVRIALADEVWYLSKFHATTLGPALLKKMEPKIWYTRNGIDTARFTGEGSRYPEHVVYCSSPDRGVLTAIKAFQAAMHDRPAAALHVCYGFNKNFRDLAAKQEYGNIPDLARDMAFYDYMRLVMSEIDKDSRIVYHGRVDGAKLAKLMQGSGVWLYPTRFPEISCMSAMEAQAAGCRIVASDTGALAETIDWSFPAVFKVSADDPDGTARRLREAVFSDSSRTILAECSKKRFCYERLADEWAGRLRCK